MRINIRFINVVGVTLVHIYLPNHIKVLEQARFTYFKNLYVAVQ